LFSYGSTRKEVLDIMGIPELVDDNYNTPNVVSWYYGNTQLQFKGDYLYYVSHEQECKHFIDYHTMIASADPIERRFAITLLQRVSNNNLY
jgi:outer membrane protein assembly factor BamE (lipoprotein component of BamABCDE complex)